MPSMRSSAATKCISDVPGLAKHTLDAVGGQRGDQGFGAVHRSGRFRVQQDDATAAARTRAVHRDKGPRDRSGGPFNVSAGVSSSVRRSTDLRGLDVLVDLIEVHVAVDLGRIGVDHAHVGVVLGHGGHAPELGGDRRQLGRCQVARWCSCPAGSGSCACWWRPRSRLRAPAPGCPCTGCSRASRCAAPALPNTP